jgi:hypothetical protein
MRTNAEGEDLEVFAPILNRYLYMKFEMVEEAF